MMAEIFGPVKGPLLPSDILIIVMLFLVNKNVSKILKLSRKTKTYMDLVVYKQMQQNGADQGACGPPIVYIPLFLIHND